MILIILLLIVCIAIYFNHLNKNTEGTQYWRTLFRHITDTILKYHTGSPTKVVLYALYLIGLFSGASTLGFPMIKAFIERNEETGFWKIFFECQWESFNIWMGVVSIVAIAIIVVIYLFTYKRYCAQDKEIGKQWMAFISEQAQQQLDEIIASENLKREQTIAFVRKAFQTGEVEMQGTAITQCLPPLPLFSPNNEREQSKQRVLNKLCAYFDKFYDIYNFVEGPITVNIYENGI